MKHQYLSIILLAYLIALFGIISFLPPGISQFTTRFPSFCIGLAACSMQGFVYKSSYNIFGIIAITIAFVYKFIIMRAIVNLPDDYTYILLSVGIITLCFINIKLISITIYISHCLYHIIYSLFSFLGRHSLEIYLVHEFIYRYTYRFFIMTPIPLLIQLIIGLLVSILISFVFGRATKSLTASVFACCRLNN